MILYLHGFRSSPESFKARLMARALAERGLAARWRCPQLPASPAAALDLALRLARDGLAASGGGRGRESGGEGPAGGNGPGGEHGPGDGSGSRSGTPGGSAAASLTVIGSSLGGFYATWLAERLGCRAVLINPVVHAARDLATQVGSHRTFHGGEPFEFLPEYVEELARAEAGIPVLTRPERYFLLAATGDEVLDWREMRARYAGCRQRIIEGGDHGLSDFADWLPEVLAFVLDGEAADAGPAPGRASKLPASNLAVFGPTAGPVPHPAPGPGSAASASGVPNPKGGVPGSTGSASGSTSGAPSPGSGVPSPAGAGPTPRVVVGAWEDLGPQASRIRSEVFVHEQNVPPELELDPLDIQCVHAIAYAADGRAVGTGRLLPDGHIGRMAVRRPWRGRGVGSLLLAALMAEARRRGDREVVLAAQSHAQDFYARHGFEPEGETFMEAGIPHVLMRRRFPV